MQVEINWLGVLLAAVANMVVGMVWYARPVFGERWKGLVKLDESRAKKEAPVAIAGAFVLAIMTAYILAHVTYISGVFFNVSYMESAFNTAFWLWLGISATTILTHGLFEQRRKKLMIMTVAHQLVTYMVMAAVLGLFKP